MIVARKLPTGINIVDNRVFGTQGYGSSYFVGSEPVAIVDPGTSHSVSIILNALQKYSIPAGGVKYILLTHVHLDHAGAAGYLAEKLPNAEVCVHEKGIKHLKDPGKLVRSMREATGERASKYGDMKPISVNQLHSLSPQETLNLGDRKLTVFLSPGHAPHHVCFFDRTSRHIFTGDAAGLHLNNTLVPSTPPPTFNLEQNLSSLKKLQTVEPQGLLYSHYGRRSDPNQALSEYRSLLQRWVSTISNHQQLRGDYESFVDKLEPAFQFISSETVDKHELKMNLEGVLQYLDWCKSQDTAD